MQGPWKVMRVEKGKESSCPDARIIIYKNGIINVMGMGKLDHICRSFKIDPTKSPKTIDLLSSNSTSPDGFGGIYDFGGEQMKICLTKHIPQLNNDQRPKNFTIDPNSADTLYVLEREQLSADDQLLQGGWNVGILDIGHRRHPAADRPDLVLDRCRQPA
jgi:uncharacterized protein (TIGR03067 family)